MSNLAQNSPQLYRITYEAYSKFANDVNRCSSLEEIAEVCKTHLKYLINFRLIRMTIFQNKKFYFFEQYGNKVWVDLKGETDTFSFENSLLESGVPLLTNQIPDKLLRKKVELDKLYDPVLWGWCFDKNDRKIIVSLVADQEKTFSVGDIEILKLMVDSVQSKFSEIFLKKQLAKQNRDLLEAYDTIKLQNDEIQRIVENQKQIIDERTAEIVQKNKKLLHVLALNAHSIREPLSRIQGITQLFEMVDEETRREDLIPKLESTVEEMDDVLKEVVDMASKELTNLKSAES
jgi:signal transduction histidine kinase